MIATEPFLLLLLLVVSDVTNIKSVITCRTRTQVPRIYLKSSMFTITKSQKSCIGVDLQVHEGNQRRRSEKLVQEKIV